MIIENQSQIQEGQEREIKEAFQTISTQRMPAFLREIIEDRAHRLSGEEALKLLFELDLLLYRTQGRMSIRYGKGLHTKHYHIQYHEFFIQNIDEGEHVFDIGSGNGHMCYQIAQRVPDVTIETMEIEPDHVKIANEKHYHPRIVFAQGDVTRDLPHKTFDVVTLSNVLEHIEDRVGLLLSIVTRLSPKKIIVRVPVYDRDWRVPLKEELGIDHRLDPTHFIEYTQASFQEEMTRAGLNIQNIRFCWGEIWSVLAPVSVNE